MVILFILTKELEMGKKQKITLPVKVGAAVEIVTDVKSAQFVGKLIENPLKTAAEVTLGLWEGGKIESIKSIGRIMQAARAKQGAAQLFSELRKYQEKGEIKTDKELADDPYVMKSLIDLLEIIDNNPEEDRLAAIKSAFFLLLKKDRDDQNDIIAYELFEISKKLTSSELITLKAAKDLAPRLEQERVKSTNRSPSITMKQWCRELAEEIGHPFTEIVKRDVEKLAKLYLIPEVITTSSVMDPINYKPSELGYALLEAIESYRKDGF